jgi:hypothetical protein
VPNPLLDRAADLGGTLLSRLQGLKLPGVGTASVSDDPGRAARRWRAVTVLRSPDDVRVDDLPAPLAALGSRVEVRVTPAPGDKGTELAARYRVTPSEEEVGRLRAALREAKQLLETGVVLRMDPRPHGARKQTPQGRLLDGVAANAKREGVL